MSEQPITESIESPVPAGRPEVLITTARRSTDESDASPESERERIDSPGKILRIGTMLKRLLGEVRAMELDEASRIRLREIYDMSVGEVSGALSPELRNELARLATPFEQAEPPSAAELQVAKAQLVGWLEGLISGMQAMLFAQESAARRQLDAMRAELVAPPEGGPEMADPRGGGTYL